MVCVNSLVRNGLNQSIKFNTSHNYSTIYHSLLDKSSDVFVSKERSLSKKQSPLIDAVKNAVPLIKPPRVKLADNLREMIIDITKVPTVSVGKDAAVYPIKGHPDLVLRVEQKALKHINDLKENLELVPISFNKEILQNKNLGIPLYYVTSKGSNIAKKTTISPLEAMAQTDKIMILRKVTGEHPSKDCGDKLLDMIGITDSKTPDVNLLNNFMYVFGYVMDNFGPKSAQKCIQSFKSGAEKIPQNALGEGSAPFEIVNGQDFLEKYQAFADSYVKSLKDISELPQEAYDKAVKFVASKKNFNVDFQHTNNTFVDLEKQEFNFMDFAYDQNDTKYIYENPVKEFRNVLFGKFCKNLTELKKTFPIFPYFKYPRDFIVMPEHIKEVKEYSKTINDKINVAAPDEYKSVKIFS